MKKFTRESNDLISEGGSDLPRPIEYYVKVFTEAFNFLEQKPDEIATLHNEFVTFSERLLNFINQKSGEADMASFFDSDILDK